MLRSSEIKPLFVDLSHCDKSFLFFTDSTHTAYGRPLLFTFTSSTHTAYGTLSPCPRLCLAYGTRCDRLQSALLWVWPKSYLYAHLYAHRVWNSFGTISVNPLVGWPKSFLFLPPFFDVSHMNFFGTTSVIPLIGMTEVVPFFFRFFLFQFCAQFWSYFFSKRVNIPKR